jgi:MFS transporter, PPP family, 3-phenylpropionic acid transporter
MPVNGGSVGLQQRSFAWSVGAFYGALFLVYGVSMPYLPVYLDARGLTAAEIGLVASAPLFLRLILTPVIGVHGDRSGNHRAIIVALGAAALGAIMLVALARGFWPILLCVTIYQVAIQSIMPLIETIAMAGVRQAGHDYGRMRLCGSATFILATLAGASVIGAFDAGIVIWLLMMATGLTLAAGLALPKPAVSGSIDCQPRPTFAAALGLLRGRPMLLFLIAVSGAQSAHAVFYAFGVLHWRASGISPEWIGVLWSIGVVAEIALFWWSAALLRQVTAIDLIGLSALAAVVRWTLMAFDPPLGLLVPLQVLHGLTFGASHLGAMHYIKDQVGERQAGTAQALHSTVTSGIGMGLAMVLAGFAYQRYGGLSYLFMAILAAIALAAWAALRHCAKAEARPLRV